MFRKFILLLLCTIIMPNITVLAHSNLLAISYDECSKEELVDGENELWYRIDELFPKFMGTSLHISDTTTQIKYYFSSTSDWIDFVKQAANRPWYNPMSNDEAAAIVTSIQTMYIESMQKWNDIYYYSYTNGIRNAHKVISILPGSEIDHNLIIHPKYEESTSIATTAIDSDIDDFDILAHNHAHIPKYKMEINIYYFFNAITNTGAISKIVSENAGAHEIGHMLGLGDLDEWDCKCQCNYCQDDDSSNDSKCTYWGHHEEALMGYGEHAYRTDHITYKDIAGVSITRGFHADNDHLWMLRKNDDETCDVICALCNGVRFDVQDNVIETNNIYYYLNEEINLMGSCYGEHSVNEDNMVIVAFDGKRLFYKCQYCRYISEVEHTTHHFEDATYINENTHAKKCVACNYLTITDHNLIYTYMDTNNHRKNCALCNLSVTEAHNYNKYQRYSSTQHINVCECGAVNGNPSPHIVRLSDITLNIGHCMYCGAKVMLGDDFVQVPWQSIQKVTVNGSYILPNGIIVLVDEDIEAYENGTLVFYDKDDLPVTQ